MQKCFLVTNKVTQVKEYLERRSIIEVTEEHRNLAELDLNHIGIIDVDKFIYIYYGSDDGDLAFRSDLNILRHLSTSPFFHTSEGIFILVDCSNPMLEDMINSACKETKLIGNKLRVIHHVGALTLNDVSKYISGEIVGSQSTSSYKTVYIREGGSNERERYSNTGDGLDSVLPVLTDHYTMYRKRAEVEAISSSRVVTDKYSRPNFLHNFSDLGSITVNRWNAFLISGDIYTGFEHGVAAIVDYLEHIGVRSLVVDVTSGILQRIDLPNVKRIELTKLVTKHSISEQTGYISCRYNQIGYVFENIDNIENISRYIFVCDSEHYSKFAEYLAPLCERLWLNFVKHYEEESIVSYLGSGMKSTTLFLSTRLINRGFDIKPYKNDFKGQRVAFFNPEDSTDFYECAIGGGDR